MSEFPMQLDKIIHNNLTLVSCTILLKISNLNPSFKVLQNEHILQRLTMTHTSSSHNKQTRRL